MSDKKKIVYISIGIILVVLFIAAFTYAAEIIAARVTNGNYTSISTCFDINYDITNKKGISDVSGTLFPSKIPTNGLGGDVSFSINGECNVSGRGNLYLNVSSVDSRLTTTVAAHCEDSATLETISEYTSSACTNYPNGVWVTSGTPLKYAIYDTVSTNPIEVGYITETTDYTIYSDFEVNYINKTYSVYVWLDGNLVDESYSSYSFSGYIHADVTQVE